MDIKKLNEELEKYILNELSDKTKQAYIAGRQAQVDAALAELNKAKAQVKKSDARQVSKLPIGIDKETATNALEDLKSEMRRIDSGSDWRLEEQDDEMTLAVRYWGEWHGDDGSGDYDWQQLDDNYRDKLNGILTKVQKKYGVKISCDISEKNWIEFDIKVEHLDLDAEKKRISKLCLDTIGKELPSLDKNPLEHWDDDDIGSGAALYHPSLPDKYDEVFLYINNTDFNPAEDGHDDVYVGFYTVERDVVQEYFNLPASDEKIKEIFKKMYIQFYKYVQFLRNAKG